MKIKRIQPVFLGIALALAVIVCACGSSQADDSNSKVPFQTVEQGAVLAKPNSINTTTLYVIRSETDWKTFWDRFALASPTSMPSINFDENQIIAAVDGIQSADGHSLTITEVQSTSTGAVVSVLETSPDQSCSATSWVNQPVHLIITPVIPGDITLNLTQKVTDCSTP